MTLGNDWFTEIHADGGSAFSLKLTKKLHEEQSTFQRIEVFATEDYGNLMTIDGLYMVSGRDNFLYHRASQPERGVAMAAGGQHAVRVGPSGMSEVVLAGGTHWSACAVDGLGGEWVAGASRIWFSAGEGAPWKEVWKDASWTAPFVSIHADADHVVLVTAEGGVLEGRSSVPDRLS